MYWRMLAINPAVAGEIVLAEKPAITTDADRMDRGALDQLLLHTGTLGSIYHKNPEVGTSLCRVNGYTADECCTIADVHPECYRESPCGQSCAEPTITTGARAHLAPQPPSSCRRRTWTRACGARANRRCHGQPCGDGRRACAERQRNERRLCTPHGHECVPGDPEQRGRRRRQRGVTACFLRPVCSVGQCVWRVHGG